MIAWRPAIPAVVADVAFYAVTVALFATLAISAHYTLTATVGTYFRRTLSVTAFTWSVFTDQAALTFIFARVAITAFVTYYPVAATFFAAFAIAA